MPFNTNTFLKNIARPWLAALLPGCLIAATAAGAFAALLEVHARRVLPERADKRLQERLDTAAERLDSRLAPLQAQLYLMRDWFRSASVSPADGDALNRLCLPVLTRTPGLETMRVASADGTEWMLAREGAGWLSRRIEVIDGERVSSWTRWDADGAPVAREDRGSTSYDPRRTAWYRGALAHLDTWSRTAVLEEPALYWSIPDWSAPPDALRFVFSLGMAVDTDETVICFEARPGTLLRTACLGLAPDGGVAAVPDGMSPGEAEGVAAALSETDAAAGAMALETEDRTLWVRTAPYVISPDMTLTLAALAPEPELRELETGLQHAALLVAPIVALVLTVLLRGLERIPVRAAPESGAAALDHQSGALPAPGQVPPQAYLQALDGARKQARRLRAALEAEQRGREHANTHWHDTVIRTDAGRKALFSLLASEDAWHGPPEAALDRFVEVAAQTLVLDWCSVWRMDAGAKTLRCLARTGFGEAPRDAAESLTRHSHPMFFLALEVESILSARDAESDPRLQGCIGDGGLHPLCARAEEDARRALLVVPLRTGNRLLGALCLERSSRWHGWEADEAAFAQGLAQMLALRFYMALEDV